MLRKKLGKDQPAKATAPKAPAAKSVAVVSGSITTSTVGGIDKSKISQVFMEKESKR